ncbi:MAG TPA: STAS domain-containing protein [Candidatus Acidoferrum sp.]|jgi:anti-sigma B factor antagonist|nr:STAS domain-containing protein [Candidatus Acidoferrum sp.]
MALRATYRDAGSVTVVDLSGRITLGDGSALLRKTIRGLLQDERKKILLNLADVDYIDSSGIGELVSGFTAVKNQSGELKLLQLTKKVRDILQITKLYTVFDVYTDENTAIRSFP